MLAAAVLFAAAGCPSRVSSSSQVQLPPPPAGPIEPGSVHPLVTAPAGRFYLTFSDGLSDSFLLAHAAIVLDGRYLLYCDQPEDQRRSLDLDDLFLVYDGALSAGNHSLSVDLVYRGNGSGVFSYLQGYTFHVRSSHVFELPESSFVALHVAAIERGGPETALEDRPSIAFEDRSADPVSVTAYRGCPWVDSPTP
jgi:hypothetical protein